MTATPLTEGELWARARLQELFDGRFSPIAIGRFLLASQRRATDVRRSRPQLARREAQWAAAGATAWMALASAGAQPFRRSLRAGLGGWGVTIVMLDWHLGMLETEDGVPRNLGPADAATLIRAWLVPAVADTPSALLCVLGFATDVADGVLARATTPTRFGRDLEGLVDTCFAGAALRGAYRHGRLGRCPVVMEATRLTLGFAYALTVYFGAADAPDPAVMHAGRRTGPIRAAGVLCACAGRRRAGDVVLLIGSASGALTITRALAAGRR